jgi:hypothetical protein
MSWTKVNFGKHKGKTIPQILFSDPDWFFWAIENNVFENKGKLLKEAEDINYKAKNIKIPNNDADSLLVEYVVHPPTRKFSHFKIISADLPIPTGGSPTFRSQHIDMSMPRQISKYDKLGCKQLLLSFKFYFLGSKSAKFTKKRCEHFFENENHFVNS